MKPHNTEPEDTRGITDDQLSLLLRKWEAPAAPPSLEARVFRARLEPSSGPKWWIPAVALAVAALVGFGFWSLRHRTSTQIQVAVSARPDRSVSPAGGTPVAVYSEGRQQSARKEQRPAGLPDRPLPQGGFSTGTYSTLLYDGGSLARIDGKPAPQEQPQAPAPSNPLRPAGVYRIGNGVTAPGVIQKKEPEYSEEARIARLAGTSVLSVVVGEDGTARNFTVTRPVGLGLDEKAIEAVSAWKFKPGMKEGMPVAVFANIEINFRMVEPSLPVSARNGNEWSEAPWRLKRAAFNPPGGASRAVVVRAPYPAEPGPEENADVQVSFDVDPNGTPINFHAISNPNLPRLESEAIFIVSSWQFTPGRKDGQPVSVPCTLDFVRGAGAPPAPGSAGQSPAVIRVGSAVQAANLLEKRPPVYPPAAKAARIQGLVTLQVRIGKDGHVTGATVISGDPALVSAAIEGVSQWLYRPTLLNGQPVEVDTQVDVNFTLSR